MALVAILGRPNVGKSTLFNRIVGRRTAIVDDEPGVTRDRNYAHAEWAGRRFVLIDTGGYVPRSEDLMEAAIREQAEAAVREADCLLLVVDAAEGLLPADRELADILRVSGKPVILVVNKVDSERRESSLGEFYAAGLGDPVAASALGGRRIGDLLDMVVGRLPGSDAQRSDPRLRIAVLGKPNVGKSSLVNALLGEKRHIVTPLPGTTRDAIDAILRHRGEEILLIDTAGLRRKSRIRESVEFYSALRTLTSIERADVAVILLDAVAGVEHQDLRIVEDVVERRRGTVLALNKWDLVTKDQRTASLMESAVRSRLRRYDYIPMVTVSALTGQRVHKLLDLARAVDGEQKRKIPTSELNRRVQEAVRAFPPRSKSGRELSIKYATQVRTQPPTFALFCNEPTMVEETYRRYLENRLREHFPFTGVPLVLSFKKK
ncbi:MAG: ribosome biogenesis GTPase Der [Bacteroidota bacterium]